MSNRELPDESVMTPTGIRKHSRLPVRLVCLIAAALCLFPIGDTGQFAVRFGRYR